MLVRELNVLAMVVSTPLAAPVIAARLHDGKTASARSAARAIMPNT